MSLIRRGFSILEVLVVVLLLLLIMALVVPVSITEIRRASLNESWRQVEAGVMRAQAEAQRRGVVLQLIARDRATEAGGTAGATEMELVTRDVFGEGSEAMSRAGSTGAGTDAGLTGPVSEAREEVILVLPSGVRISDALPRRFAAPDETGFGEDATESASPSADGAASSERPEWLIATFFPDGRVSTSWTGGVEPAAVAGASRGCFVFAESGAAWSIRVNSWTGAVEATAILPAAASREILGEGDDAPGPAPEEGVAAP
ncbi:MAG: prepilin-type N-terminal cleavage/methylation domain-containing protein [Phycisphaerales bacterium]